MSHFCCFIYPTQPTFPSLKCRLSKPVSFSLPLPSLPLKPFGFSTRKANSFNSTLVSTSAQTFLCGSTIRPTLTKSKRPGDATHSRTGLAADPDLWRFSPPIWWLSRWRVSRLCSAGHSRHPCVTGSANVKFRKIAKPLTLTCNLYVLVKRDCVCKNLDNATLYAWLNSRHSYSHQRRWSYGFDFLAWINIFFHPSICNFDRRWEEERCVVSVSRA